MFTSHNDSLLIKKQLNLPPVMVQFSDHHGADIQPFILGEGVREEDELPLVLLVPVDDSSDLVGIFPTGQLAIHVADCIRQDARSWRETPLPFHRSEVIVLLASDDEVGSDGFYRIQPLEVVVASIEDVERVLFVWDGIHGFHVVHTGFSYVKECWNRRFNVIQSMNLDSSLSLVLPINSPLECIQAELYRS